jgi:hypothetical protein
MKQVRQSHFLRFRRVLVRVEMRLKISDALSRFKRAAKVPTLLSEEYHFRGTCAGMLESLGYIVPGYIDAAAKLVREKYAIEKSEREEARMAPEVH